MFTYLFHDKIEINRIQGQSTKMKYTIEIQNQYLQTLNEKEKQGYEIAKSHLGSSFDLTKSYGFLDWVKSQQPPIDGNPPPTEK